MSALVLTVYRHLPFSDSELLKPLLVLCGAGLLILLLPMTYGLDLSYGFF
jgi:hypothetical protein